MFTNFSNSHRLIEDPTEWFFVEDIFTEEEIDKILKHVEKFPMFIGTTETLANTDETLRKSFVKWVPHNFETSWLYDKILGYIDHVNNNYWKFDLYDVKESIQYTEYPEDGGHYEWHLDLGKDGELRQRKVSVTIQLSDENDYEGGRLEILRGKEPEVAPRKKGTMILFPSYLLHRVTPVTKGVRKSLVLWVGGGSFK